jgi:nucleoside 2-deoxyribosyltransferase
MKYTELKAAQQAKYKLEGNYWTSDLYIEADKPIDLLVVKALMTKIEDDLSKFNKESLANKGSEKDGELYQRLFNRLGENLEPFVCYDGKPDYTGLLKGLLLELLCNEYQKQGYGTFLINFGGDVIGYNRPLTSIRVSDHFQVERSGDFSIFTSNNLARKGHIKYGAHNAERPYESVTVVIDSIQPIYADYLATDCYANGRVNDCVFFTKDGYPIMAGQHGYGASPFFNDYERKVKAAMYSKMSDVFDPESTDTSKQYDAELAAGKHSAETAQLIFQDNVDHILIASYLVFPKDTNDLGTLMEVGVAIKESRSVIAYDYGNDMYSLTDYLHTDLETLDAKSVLDCSNKSNAILLGYNYDNKGPIYYTVGFNNDNIMLACLFTRVEYKDSKYVEVEVDMNTVQ